MALLSTVAVFNVGAAPFDLSLETYNISLRDINEEAAKQMIRRPSFGQELTIYSSLANGFIHVKPGTTGARSLRIKNRRTVADNKLIRSWSDSYDSIVSFITRRALVPESITWEFTGAIERLAREGDELVARVVEEKDAAQFMLMRYPPLCGDAEVVEKPQFVQLMLVERHGGSYHRALLHAVYNRKGQVEMKFLQTSSEVGDDCKRPESPSVLPGTLFMLSYD
ncbi:uncharacterized protein [Watersipora subatra]|uniref:uncharacterized protein n=1 Tax=Watersipora subatra TaxID=2589382 RepID=UPI00355B4E11